MSRGALVGVVCHAVVHAWYVRADVAVVIVVAVVKEKKEVRQKGSKKEGEPSRQDRRGQER
jgi:hypothetical protein